MIKRTIRILFEAFVYLLLFNSVAHAGLLAAAIGALSNFIIGGTILGKIVGFVLLTAAKFGVGLLERALAGNKDQRQPGIKGSIQIGGTNPLSFIVGLSATAGQLEYVNTWGDDGDTPNAYVSLVISVSDIPVDGLDSTIWINGKKCSIGALDANRPILGNVIPEFNGGKGKHHAWINFYDGTQTAADPLMVQKFTNDLDRPWTTNCVGNGIAYAVVTFLFNRKLYTAIPSVRFVVRGIKLYNPAKDSTNGGSGSHRWGDLSTYEYAEDNATIIYNLTRGIYANGRWYYGGQNLPQPLLPTSTWIASYNECETEIPLKEGGTEKQFRSGYEIDVNTQPLDTIDKFLVGCNGRMAEIGGFYKLRVGAPGPSVYSFTDGDIVATQDLDFDPFPGLQSTFNGATARYPEPDESWELKDAPQYIVAEYEAADEGKRLLANLSLSTTFSNTQVQRLMKASVEANRRFRIHVVALPPEAWVLEPAIDTIDWTSAREGYAAKDFVITGMTGQPGMIQYVQILEIDSSDYNWVPATDQKDYFVGYTGDVRPPAQVVYGWAVEQYTLQEGNNKLPSVLVSYAGQVTDVTAVQIQIRPASTGVTEFDGSIPYDAETNPLLVKVVPAHQFLPNAPYELRGRYIPGTGRDTEWTDWLPVTTPDVWISASVDYNEIIENMGEDLKWLGSSIHDAQRNLARLNQIVSGQDTGNYNNLQSLRRELNSTTNNLTAGYTEAILVATGPTSGLAVRIGRLEVSLTDTNNAVLANSTIINSQQTTITQQGNAITANAQAIDALSVTVGQVAADVSVKAEAGASPGGGWARYGVLVKLTNGNWANQAGLIIDVNGSLSRLVLLAKQTVISTDGTDVLALFTADGLYIDNARIKNLTADNITAKSLDAEQVLQDGTLITDLIAFDAITDKLTMQGGGQGFDGNWTTITTMTCANPNPNPILMQYNLTAVAYLASNSGSYTSTVRLQKVSDLTTIDQVTASRGGSIGQNTQTTGNRFFIDDTAGINEQYRIQIQALASGSGSATGNGVCKTLWWKR